MDKQKLRALPVMPAPAWMTKEAFAAKLRRNDIELWYADVKKEADIIVLRIYERSKLIGGIAYRENIRVYLDVEDREYISQNMDFETAKSWRTGRLDSVLSTSDRWGGCWPSFEWETGYVKKGYSPYLSFNKAGEDTLEKALGPLEGEETWGLRIYKWQDKILKEKLLRRHDKELEPVVELMKQVPELPETFAEWLCTDGIARFDYVIYDPPKGRKQTRIQCTRCGAKMTVDVKKIHPVRDKRGICPACGRPITWKTTASKLDRGCTYYRWDEPWYVAIIQRMGEGLIVRYFFADVKFILDHGEVKGRNCEWGEVCREIFREGHRVHFYERIRYKNQGEIRWAPGVGEYNTGEAFLYTENLPEVLKGTIWKYSGLKELQQKSWPYRIPITDYMKEYPRKPFLEYFSKMGLRRLVSESLWYGAERNFDTSSTKPDQLLRIPKQDIRTLIKLDGGLTMLDVMQDAYLSRIRLSEDELVHYVSLFGSSPNHLMTIFSGDIKLDVHRLLKYLRKQAEKAFDRSKWNKRYTKAEAMLALERNLCEDWHDYLGWLEKYMPDCLADLYYLLPPNLPEAHDRLMKIALEKKEKEEAERRRKQEEAVKRFFEEMKETGGIEMQARGLMIRLPKDAGEIRREGELQHHCVATYIDRVERHETLILFVRKIEDPDTPFYTMEWKDGKVAQCRGMRNAAMTPEVKAFVGAFERKMQKKDQEAVRQRVKVTA